MLTRFEARKLESEMRRELEAPVYTLWKCVAGLLFVTALALTGAGSLTSPEPGTHAAQASSR